MPAPSRTTSIDSDGYVARRRSTVLSMVFSRVVNRVRVPGAFRRPRVYTMWAAPLLLLLAAAACGAQTPRELTIDPVMVKGPAEAPVTIVEFSDYQ